MKEKETTLTHYNGSTMSKKTGKELHEGTTVGCRGVSPRGDNTITTKHFAIQATQKQHRRILALLGVL